MPLLEIKGLSTEFSSKDGVLKAVRDVSWHVEKGEIIGIVGESGSGKSVTMLSVMGLLADSGRVTEGEIIFNGQNISPAGITDKKGLRQHDDMMRKIRLKEMSMVFQDPMTYLNPVLKVGTQLMWPIMQHCDVSRSEARKRAIELMKLVGIPSPEKRLRQYPHEFSGGMRQRIIIAIALSCNPKLIIADEPTTALDVTIQAQILDLIKGISDTMNTSVVMITHDLGVVASMCSRIIIMYGGKIVEEGTDREIFYEPRHPYTKGLLGSINDPDCDEDKKLFSIPGSPPDLLRLPQGCPFVDRCDHAMRVCKVVPPVKTQFSATHHCECWLYQRPAKEDDHD